MLCDYTSCAKSCWGRVSYAGIKRKGSLLFCMGAEHSRSTKHKFVMRDLAD